MLHNKAMFHAYTSFVMPDPLTNRTGTEEAFHCLQSGHCQPWTILSEGSSMALANIARLTPTRGYYSEDLKVMQVIRWDPHLTTYTQHDGYRAVEQIKSKSEQLAMFSRQKEELFPLQLFGDRHLTSRSLSRCSQYERPVCPSEVLDSDEVYVGRDRKQANVITSHVAECTTLLRNWPLKFATMHELASFLQEWPSVQGYQGSFAKILITELLDVDLPSE